ncbi:hypothetical protein PTTG_01122 [Puccinia triticina 1-1 BBBD Race 1]|uniref:Uncharacterized protein n=2 Tax=Puccinia triticina TaxID=208348 RepID=A0A180GZN2_PUCT1|nr:uncharacterized protein PtA15_10A591 [Puccinia triticina]OAV97712.1 hypothetical protein PTTG_01122 [Puccinia triticina 1-1 BBBD Race 1]WAQ89167.1 hypothetical protein PtA15_10A591 [Puccinia triticina]WAR59225.1 hypothetical protein PtB15_10B567 [Puccinia triticina]
MAKEIEGQDSKPSEPSAGNQSDEAQPVSQSPPPELPPKTALQSYPSIITTTNHPTQSNKTLIRFLFSLSNLIFFGGTLAGLIVWLYQKYIFPKLKIRTEILVSLRRSTLKSYDKLQESLKSLVQSNPKLYNSAVAILSGKNRQIFPTSSGTQTGDELEEAGKSSNQIEPSEASTTADDKIQVPKNIQFDSTVTIIPSSSSPSPSSSILDENEHQNEINEDQRQSATREEFNQPIIDYLGKIAKGLRKRSENRGRIQTEESDDGQRNESSAGMQLSLEGMESLKTSLKAMSGELADETQLTTRIHQKISASSHPHRAFGLNYWATSFNAARYPDAPPIKNVDEDPYFIALMEFKNQIRALKGVLLNRKKFY